MASNGFTTRRGMIETLIGLGAAGALHAALDSNAWRAYESVEEAWIRDRHALLIKQSPQIEAAAQIDLDLKLAELQRRAIQFRHLVKRNPRQLRGGVWQLSWLPFTEKEKTELESADPAYKRQERKIRGLADSLREHPDYDAFRNAQTRLWKTPEYKEIHRKYSGRMQELHKTYGGASFSSP
jgi:hypothetical protein